ncbi:hypothetical protein [Roseobacter sinensis]|uniref:Ribbon-helix-helix protein CopG domain-containing protein n=1 Tax=Roseobacter sinensis TaxID=2931391 RepID=A0ABT3B9Q2_9RHOB|nr:hypothetical protein [Roseobacter sp. WL0113]MCV3270159.1 hypothetical protein [Roseobacter sp. WL0113]
MTSRTVSIQLPADLALAVHDLATEREGTVAKLVEEVLVAHLAAHRRQKKKSEIVDPRLAFALQRLLFRDMAEAKSWEDLDARLSRHGYFLKIAWGGLSLHTETSGQKLCNTSDLGFSYVTFLRRFGPGKPKDPRET